MSGTGTKTAYTFIIINHKITVLLAARWEMGGEEPGEGL